MTPAPPIETMVRRIVDRFHPERVILFGSYARGTATKDSDIDLAVIFSSLEGKRRQKAVEIGVAIGDFGISQDVLVLTEKDYEEQKPWVGTLGHILAREGKILYARRPA